MDKQIKPKLRRIWCERLVIGLCLPVALGFSVVKLKSLYYLNERLQKNATVQMLRLEVKTQQYLANSAFQEAEVALWLNLERKQIEAERKQIEAERKQIEAEKKLMEVERVSWQKLKEELLLLSISAISLIVMLILLLKQQNRISLTLTGQLICFLPEECIAEVEALRQHLKSKHHSNLFVQAVILWTFLELLWVFYIQIKIENLCYLRTEETRKLTNNFFKLHSNNFYGEYRKWWIK